MWDWTTKTGKGFEPFLGVQLVSIWEWNVKTNVLTAEGQGDALNKGEATDFPSIPAPAHRTSK